jgi:hypothetical protein
MNDPDHDGPETYLPTWRKPIGLLALLLALFGYALIVAGLSGIISEQAVLAQTLIYLILGTVWLLPLRRFLIWMETGRWG